MALEPDPASVLGTPENYASPQQLAMARQLAMALMKPQQGQFMQSWTQPASQILNALVGAKMMQGAGASERANAAGMVGLPGGSPLGQTGGPAPTGDIGDGLTRITTQSGVPFTVAAEHADKFQGFLNDLEAAGYRINNDPSGGGYNPRNIAGTNTPSQHSFGRAIDINPSVNARGTEGNIPPDLAQALAEKHGLTWGGKWNNPDPMHFEVNPNAKVADAGNAPQNPAGAQPQAMVPPTGQPQGMTPGAPTSPQGASGAPSPQLLRQAPITRDMVYSALVSGHPFAGEMMKMYLEQQQPQEIKQGDVTYRYLPGHPETMSVVPQPHQFHEGEAAGVKYPYQTQQGQGGFTVSPLQQAGASGPAAAPSAGAPSPGAGGFAMPTDFPSAANTAVQMTGAKKQAELDATTHNKIYTGIVGTAVNAAEQQQNIHLIEAIMADPSYPVGGTGSNLSQFIKTALATTGLDPNAATPRALIHMLGARILQQQLSAMKSASSEVGENAGRIFATQVPIEEKALINETDADPVIRAKVNLLNQEGQLAIQRARMAHDYAATHGGRIDNGFVQQYIEQTAKQRLNQPPQEQTPAQTSRTGGFSRPMSAPQGWSIKRIDQ